MAEVIRVDPKTGGMKGRKPERLDLVALEGTMGEARVAAFGASKYSDNNWRKGYDWGESFAAACRHLFLFWLGEDLDKESGECHLLHAKWHMSTLYWFWLHGQGTDNRWMMKKLPPIEETFLSVLRRTTFDGPSIPSKRARGSAARSSKRSGGKPASTEKSSGRKRAARRRAFAIAAKGKRS